MGILQPQWMIPMEWAVLKGTLIHWDPHLLILDMPSLSVLGRGGSGGGGTSSGLEAIIAVVQMI